MKSVLVNAVIETLLITSQPWISAGLSTALFSLQRCKQEGARARRRLASLCPRLLAASRHG